MLALAVEAGENFVESVVQGASGLGLGSALYRPGSTPAEVSARARRFVEAVNAARNEG